VPRGLRAPAKLAQAGVCAALVELVRTRCGVRANTGLRELSWLAAWVYGPGMEWNRLPEMQEVTDILHRRVLADWEAAA